MMSAGLSGPIQIGSNGANMPPAIHMNGQSRESGGGGYFQHGEGANNQPQTATEMPHSKQTGRASTPVGIPRSTPSVGDRAELVNATLSGEMARLDVTDAATASVES